MNIPKMPEGYYLMEDTGFWYILTGAGPFMVKRLLDREGAELRFEPTTRSLEKAAAYAQRHKEAGLSYNQALPGIQVSEVKDENAKD